MEDYNQLVKERDKYKAESVLFARIGTLLLLVIIVLVVILNP